MVENRIAAKGPRRRAGSNFRRLFILGLLLAGCILFYYLGELVTLAGWEGIRWTFLYGVHDIHRLLFLAPIIYSAYVFGTKATIIITIVSANTMLPRAVFISPYPDPLLRMLIFIAIAGTMGYLTAVTRRESERRQRLEALLRGERDRMVGILERLPDGVLIVGPDYRIRFMNPIMIRDFGPGIGTPCYQCLHKLEQPCPTCRLPDVLNGAVDKWDYTFPDRRKYEVAVSPYIDSDGTTCQLATFRNITQRMSARTLPN